jgi:hypothetical protein
LCPGIDGFKQRFSFFFQAPSMVIGTLMLGFILSCEHIMYQQMVQLLTGFRVCVLVESPDFKSIGTAVLAIRF